MEVYHEHIYKLCMKLLLYVTDGRHGNNVKL